MVGSRDMSLKFRRTFFYLYIGLFLLVAPLVVLYTAGYRLDVQRGRLVQIGALSVTSVPKGAQVFLDDAELSDRTPTLQKRILPGTYHLRLNKEGYKPWEREVEIKSKQTTIVEGVELFLDLAPEMITPIAASVSVGSTNGLVAYAIAADQWFELWIYNPTNGDFTLLDRLSSAKIGEPQLHWSHDNYLLILSDAKNGKTEQRFYTSNGPLSSVPAWFAPFDLAPEGEQSALTRSRGQTVETIALLPKNNYQISDVFNNWVVIQDNEQERLILIDSDTQGPPILLNAAAKFYRWQESSILYSDGFELHRYNPSTNSDTLITRSSSQMTDVIPLADSQTLVITTSTQTAAIDISDISRPVNTVIVSADKIQSFWLDPRGRTGYFFGIVNGLAGLYKIALTR